MRLDASAVGTIIPSKRLSSLTRLSSSRHRISKFLPTNRIHESPLLTSCHDYTQLIAFCRDVVVPAISQTNHYTPHQVAHAEAVFNLDLVLFCSAYVFAPDLALERFAADGIVDDKDLTGCKARAEACDPGENYAVDKGKDGTAAAAAGT